MGAGRLLAALAAALLAAGCATNPVTGEPDFVLMSEEREIALGAEYHERMLERYDAYPDAALQERVRALGERLAGVSHRPGLDYHFTVLDSPAVNAFALPGGYVYITRGILAYFNSEAELAGVLGHEIGHVTARHAVQQYSAATASSILGVLVLAEAGAGRAGADLFRTVQLAAIRGYGREQELQADRLGAQYLARAGYDPEEMLDVIGVLADQEEYERDRAAAEGREPDTYHGIFATHPENDARVRRVVRAARKYAADDPAPEGRETYLRLIDGLTFGPGTDQGVVDDGTFLHRELDVALEAPEGWTVENRPDRLRMRSPEDRAELIVRVERLVEDADSTPRDLLAGQVGGARLGDARALRDSPCPGYTGVEVRSTPAGRRRVRHAVVVKGDQAWFFVGAARGGDDFQRFDETFLEVARGLDALSEAQRRRARPLEIRLHRVEAGETWGDLAADVPGRVDNPVARLRLLNGDYPEGELAAGRLVKTLR